MSIRRRGGAEGYAFGNEPGAAPSPHSGVVVLIRPESVGYVEHTASGEAQGIVALG